MNLVKIGWYLRGKRKRWVSSEIWDIGKLEKWEFMDSHHRKWGWKSLDWQRHIKTAFLWKVLLCQASCIKSRAKDKVLCPGVLSPPVLHNEKFHRCLTWLPWGKSNNSPKGQYLGKFHKFSIQFPGKFSSNPCGQIPVELHENFRFHYVEHCPHKVSFLVLQAP